MLLAQNVLRGKTKGYCHHTQLYRIQAHSNAIGCISDYLHAIHAEANRRGYCIDKTKMISACMYNQMEETDGQLMYEWKHLSKKLANRNHSLWIKWQNVKTPKPHPLFRVIAGETQKWKKRYSHLQF